MENDILEFQGQYRWLSNFWPAKVEFEGLTYASSEAAYQASKFEHKERLSFAALSGSHEDCRQAKRWGRTGGVYVSEAQRLKAMLAIVRSKFVLNPELGQKLVDTRDGKLEEGNSWGDRFWGVCPPRSGQGRNELGKILMRVREELTTERGM